MRDQVTAQRSRGIFKKKYISSMVGIIAQVASGIFVSFCTGLSLFRFKESSDASTPKAHAELRRIKKNTAFSPSPPPTMAKCTLAWTGNFAMRPATSTRPQYRWAPCPAGCWGWPSRRPTRHGGCTGRKRKG